MANFKDFMSDMRGGRLGGFSGFGAGNPARDQRRQQNDSERQAQELERQQGKTNEDGSPRNALRPQFPRMIGNTGPGSYAEPAPLPSMGGNPINPPTTPLSGGQVSIQGGFDQYGNLNGSIPYQYEKPLSGDMLRPQPGLISNTGPGSYPFQPGMDDGFGLPIMGGGMPQQQAQQYANQQFGKSQPQYGTQQIEARPSMMQAMAAPYQSQGFDSDPALQAARDFYASYQNPQQAAPPQAAPQLSVAPQPQPQQQSQQQPLSPLAALATPTPAAATPFALPSMQAITDFQKQGQALEAQRQQTLQGLPEYQQLQALQNNSRYRSPNAQELQRTQTLQQQIQQNPQMQAHQMQMQALSAQQPGMGGAPQQPASPLAAMGAQYQPPPLFPTAAPGGQTSNMFFGATPRMQGLLDSAKPPEPAAPEAPEGPRGPFAFAIKSRAASAAQPAQPAVGGLNQVAAMSSPTAPVKGAALPAQ